jgi:ElaB/YqjD/DUF883 family membrane-anchored ribosome-binding protein
MPTRKSNANITIYGHEINDWRGPMAAAQNLRKELDELRREFESLRNRGVDQLSGKAKEAVAAATKELEGFEGQISELNSMLHTLFEEAEESVSQHPVATIAGALALGIVIGRMTAK